MLLTFELHRDLIRKCSIFTALPADLLVPILRRLRPVIFVPRHLVVREGHPNSKLYFINRGLVHVYKVAGYPATRPQSQLARRACIVARISRLQCPNELSQPATRPYGTTPYHPPSLIRPRFDCVSQHLALRSQDFEGRAQQLLAKLTNNDFFGENTFSEAFRTRWTTEEGSLKESERPDSRSDIKCVKANATVECVSYCEMLMLSGRALESVSSRSSLAARTIRAALLEGVKERTDRLNPKKKSTWRPLRAVAAVVGAMRKTQPSQRPGSPEPVAQHDRVAVRSHSPVGGISTTRD